MNHRWSVPGVLCVVLCACGAQVQATVPAQPAATAAPPPSAPSLPVVAQPDIELRDPHVAIVGAQHVAFDGVEEGLTWPALAKAVGTHKTGDVVTIQVARTVPIDDLLRAAWLVRAADLHVQTLDSAGVMHAVELRAKRDGTAPSPGCHLAVFVRPDGSLRVAAPGGPREVGGDRAAETLARSLADERTRCSIKYVAFGAESDAAPWGPVFDAVLAVDQNKSAGDARYVLGQAIHVASK